MFFSTSRMVQSKVIASLYHREKFEMEPILRSCQATMSASPNLVRSIIATTNLFQCSWFTKPSRGNHTHELSRQDWLVQLLLALSYLHDRRILHRDIKSKNIFLKNIHGLPTTIAKLGDFGIARVLVNPADQASSLAGTPYYMSPECLRGQGYNTKSDVWSLGCVMFECCRRQLPFQADSLLGLTKQICDGTPPSLSSSFSLDLRVGLGLMLHRIPTNRPSASGLLQHPMMLPHIKRLDRTVADATLTRSQLHRESTRIREATDVSNFMSMPSNIREPAAKADGREYVVDGGNCADVTRETSRVLQMSPRERLAAKKLRAADERAKELVQGMESGTRETTDMRNRNRANAQWSDSGSAVLGVSTHNSLHVERGRGPQLSCDHSLSASREHSEPQTPPSADPWILEHPDIFPNGAPTLTMDKQGTLLSHWAVLVFKKNGQICRCWWVVAGWRYMLGCTETCRAARRGCRTDSCKNRIQTYSICRCKQRAHGWQHGRRCGASARQLAAHTQRVHGQQGRKMWHMVAWQHQPQPPWFDPVVCGAVYRWTHFDVLTWHGVVSHRLQMCRWGAVLLLLGRAPLAAHPWAVTRHTRSNGHKNPPGKTRMLARTLKRTPWTR
eukprot:m.147570 g.147570  ORF g.147570 m.147570 type:complete len:615 (-) comp17786_c0_seq20:926-2770(-)